MGRQVEIPVKIVAQGDRDLRTVKDALGAVRTETGATARALEGYDRAADGAAKKTVQAAHAVKQARDEMGRFVAGANEAGAAAGKFGGGLDASLIAKLVGVATSLKVLTQDTATYAARTETLAIVTDRLARVNNLSIGAVQAQVQAVRKQGITYQESYQTITKMISAQLDLKKATDLARLAQDAAVIGGMNSSEALAGIIHGITTRQTDVLRTYGIIVDFEGAYAKAAKAAGHELTAFEKQQVALNTVLEQGAKITGSYEAAMGTAGKQLTSLSRHFDDLKQSIGEGYVPALGRAVGLMEQFAKWGQNNVDVMQKITTAGTAAAVGYGAFQLLSLTPAGRAVRIGGAVAAAGATYFGLDQDPIEYAKDAASTQVEAMARKRSRINSEFNAIRNPTKDQAEAYKRTTTMLAEVESDLKGQVAAHLAKVYVQRGGKEAYRAENLAMAAGDLDLGNGVKVHGAEVLREVLRIQSPSLYKERFGDDAAGATFNQPGYDKAIAEAKAAEAAELAGKAAKAAAEDRKGFVEQLERLRLPQSPLTGKAYNVDAARLETEQQLRKSHPSNRGLVREIGGLQYDEALMADVAEVTKAAKAKQDFFKAAHDEYKKGDHLGDETEKLEAHARKVVEWATAWNKFSNALKDINAANERSGLQQQASRAERIAQLEAGTNGSPQVIENMYRIRLALAEQINKLDLANADRILDVHERKLAQARAEGQLKRDTGEAEIQRELQMLELQKRRLNEFRDGAGRVFDAMTQNGRAGLKDLLEGQLKNIQRTMFMNLSEKVFTGVGSQLGGALPGVSSSGPLGWIFKGTPMERLGSVTGTPPFVAGKSGTVDASTLRVTTSQDRLRMSIDNLSRVVSSSSTGLVGSGMAQIPGAGALGNGTFANTVYSGGQAVADSVTLGPLTTGPSSTIGLGGYDPGTAIYNPGTSGVAARNTSGGLSKTGTGIAVGAGALGVYAGIKQGGAQGYANAAAAGLATAAALDPEPISKAVLAISAMATSFVGQFLGPDLEKRKREIEGNINAAKFEDKEAIVRSTDRYGRDVDFDKRGNARVMGGTTQFNVNIQALDAKSIMDAGPELADSIRHQILRQHDLRDEIRQVAS